jgi:hypothetical protein
MALPKINTPTYELVVPSTDEKVKYRPFLVKEEKILMMALESKENSQIISAVKDIVQTCTFDVVDLSNRPMFDMEYIFLQIRSKSVGEISTIKLLAPDDNETYVEAEVDLSKVSVEMGEGHTNKIDLGDKMGLVMKYPSIDAFADEMSDINASNMLDVIATCIAQITEKDGEVIYEAKDSTRKEVIEFIEQLNTKQFQDVQKFFDTMPKLKHMVKIENPKTKVVSEVTLSGLNDFFA